MDTPEVPAALCQYCGTAVVQRGVVCAECGTSHHRECFLEAGACTTYACGSRAFVDGVTGARLEVEPAPSAARTEGVSKAALAWRAMLARPGALELVPLRGRPQEDVARQLLAGCFVAGGVMMAVAAPSPRYVNAGPAVFMTIVGLAILCFAGRGRRLAVGVDRGADAGPVAPRRATPRGPSCRRGSPCATSRRRRSPWGP